MAVGRFGNVADKLIQANKEINRLSQTCEDECKTINLLNSTLSQHTKLGKQKNYLFFPITNWILFWFLLRYRERGEQDQGYYYRYSNTCFISHFWESTDGRPIIREFRRVQRLRCFFVLSILPALQTFRSVHLKRFGIKLLTFYAM